MTAAAPNPCSQAPAPRATNQKATQISEPVRNTCIRSRAWAKRVSGSWATTIVKVFTA